jgi:hypothetical protein
MPCQLSTCSRQRCCARYGLRVTIKCELCVTLDGLIVIVQHGRLRCCQRNLVVAFFFTRIDVLVQGVVCESIYPVSNWINHMTVGASMGERRLALNNAAGGATQAARATRSASANS